MQKQGFRSSTIISRKKTQLIRRLLINEESANFYADGVVYAVIDAVSIELYTDEKDHKLEERIEEIFKNYNVSWKKEETYIDSEQMYEVLYQMEV